jgi:hypothetical protein
MVGMIVAVCILSVLFLMMTVMVFCELPRNARYVFCFLIMLAVGVSIVFGLVVCGGGVGLIGLMLSR